MADSTVAPSESSTQVATVVTTTTVSVMPTTTATSAPETTAAPTTVPPPVYVFPFVGATVSYGTDHHDYPAVDVFGCGAGIDARVVAPTDGVVQQSRDVDLWDPAVDDPALRGGKYVSMVGNDGVRYYFAHLDSVAVAVGDAVRAGDPLGAMGQTGNARSTVCHTHFGVSWPCPANESAVRRGAVWPWPYLDAWRAGEQRSPTLEVLAAEQANPDACAAAAAEPGADAA